MIKGSVGESQSRDEVLTEAWKTDSMTAPAFAYYHPGCVVLSPFVEAMARHGWWATHEWFYHHVVRSYYIYPTRRVHETIHCHVCGEVLRER